MGYLGRICTSPLESNRYCQTEKIRWLNRIFVPVFGKYVVEQAIFTKDKHLQSGIALIDDRPSIKDSDKAVWQHIMFDQQYNKYVELPRLYGWRDNRLPELLDNARSSYLISA